MRPPTRIRDDHASPLARDLLDAARPVRAMTAAERAASAARLAQIGAAPAVGATALWIKGLFGATVIGVAVSIAALSTARPPAPRPTRSAPATAAVTAPKPAPPPRRPPPREAPDVIAIAPLPLLADAPLPVRVATTTNNVAVPPATPPATSPATSPSPQSARVEPADGAPRATARGAHVAATGTGGGLAGVGRGDGSLLAQENQLIREARQTRAHDPHAAMQLLLEHRRRFPRGVLRAERDAELFRTLDAMGDRVRARAEGERYLEMYPRHTSAGAIRRRMEAL
jgi:hypothetical protein